MSEENVRGDKKEYSSQSVETDMGELIPGEGSSKSQPVRKTEENYMSCLCRERVLDL